MKLCWIHPTTYNEQLLPLWDRLDALIRPILLPQTNLEFRFLPRSTNFTRSFYTEHINSIHILEAALQAQRDGMDGVYFGCWNDPLWEAREILDIPVGSVGEQSMLAALSMAKRFAVITVSPKTACAIERDIELYGFTSRAIARPVRSIMPESEVGLLSESVVDPHRRFIPRFEQVAEDCIRDGAEIILVGCAYYGPLLRGAGYNKVSGTDVPVLDSSSISLKYLEMMVDIAKTLHIVKSPSASFKPPSQQQIDISRQTLGFRP